MIHFTCQHCKKSVRVDDRFGGKTGRCPHCKQTVTIPAPDDALNALAAAMGLSARADETNHAAVPPPPPVGRSKEPKLPDELELPPETDPDLADTVILPAGVFVEKKEEPAQPAATHPRHHAALDRHKPALNALRTILIVVAIIVVLIVAVLSFALASRLL